ncbi:MAG TPA: hypothetical protein VOA19_11370, partial [Actinomycetes bacterium]|nr:hypothetical protein [Actinomycetes bacterium]
MREAEGLGEPAGRHQQGRPGDGADGGGEEHGPKGPPPGVAAPQVGGGVAGQEHGRVGAPEERAAGEQDHEPAAHGGEDHGDRPHHAEGVAQDQARAAPGAAG